MKLNNLFLIAIIAAMWHSAALGQLKDTLWTRDLWQLGASIRQVKFTPDGNSVAAAIGDGVYIFDKVSGQIVKQFNRFMIACRYFDFSDDGTKLITASDNNMIIVWDYLKGNTISVFEKIFITHVRYLNDSLIIGIGNLTEWNPDSTKIYLMNFKTGKVIRKQGSENRKIVITAFDISKDNNLLSLVSVNSDVRNIEIWNLNSLTQITTIGKHNNQINDLNFSSDGKYLASASDDGLIKIWDIENKLLIKSIKNDNIQNGYGNLKFSPKAGYLVSSFGAGSNMAPFSCKVWDMKNFNLVYSYPYNIGSYYSTDISKDSSLLALGRAWFLTILKARWNPTSKSDDLNKLYIKLFPNPSSTEINIPNNEGISPIRISIMDTSGNNLMTINQVQTIDDIIKLDISRLISGIYFASVIYPDKTITYKFEIVR